MASEGDLGPTTERRFAEAFADAALITAKKAAELVGLDVGTLSALSDRQIIRAVRRGSRRAYTERDLRAYLIEGPDAEWVSPSQRKAGSGTTISSSRVVAFTDRPARLRVAQPKR